MTTYELTDDQVDIIRHAISKVYTFDGWAWLVRDVGQLEADRVADTLVALGYNDLRDDTEEEE